MSAEHFDTRRLLARIAELTGIENIAEAQHLARAVTSVLLEQLSAADRSWLAQKLPRDLADAVGTGHLSHRPADSLDEFVERVAAREAVATGFAREHAQSVCRALGEVLDDDERRLTARLPEQIASLFDSGEQPPQLAHTPHTAARRRRTLSEGRPHSRKPLSEAEPVRAQNDSLARSDNPHAETKLSSSPGTTQEREAETLARGRSRR